MNLPRTITPAESRLGRHAGLTAVALLLSACPGPGPEPSDAQATAHATPLVSKSTTGTDTHYQVVGEDCEIRWEIRDAESQVILHRSRCALALQAQVPLLEALWQALPTVGGKRRQLFWGRLCPDASCAERQLSQRLALAAFHSPGWDAGKGRPTSGHANGFVRDLLNAAPFAPELTSLFARHGYVLALGSVEKVLVSPAAALPYYDALRQQGVPADARLPFDAMTWFSLEPRT